MKVGKSKGDMGLQNSYKIMYPSRGIITGISKVC